MTTRQKKKTIIIMIKINKNKFQTKFKSLGGSFKVHKKLVGLSIPVLYALRMLKMFLRRCVVVVVVLVVLSMLSVLVRPVS